MRRSVIASILVAAIVVTIGAGVEWWISTRHIAEQAEAESPEHRSGLWEIKTRLSDSSEQTIQRCIDAANDHSMSLSAEIVGHRMCSFHKPDACTFSLVKDADDVYAISATTKVDGAPATKDTYVANWLGPCKPGQVPGQMIVPNSEGKSTIVIEFEYQNPKAVASPPR